MLCHFRKCAVFSEKTLTVSDWETWGIAPMVRHRKISSVTLEIDKREKLKHMWGSWKRIWCGGEKRRKWAKRSRRQEGGRGGDGDREEWLAYEHNHITCGAEDRNLAAKWQRLSRTAEERQLESCLLCSSGTQAPLLIPGSDTESDTEHLRSVHSLDVTHMVEAVPTRSKWFSVEIRSWWSHVAPIA